MKICRSGILVSALPSLLMLGLFYSLAIHMRYGLGAWPTSIGERGFSPSLVTHGRVTWHFCEVLFLASIFIWPAAMLVCLLVTRLRRFVVYLALYALLYLVCWGLMLLAPAPFLNWWWD
ncbi:MAG: hypothetical protein ABI651_01090 [Verrucomicrobiota bacterium]